MRTRPLAATMLLGACLALGFASPARPQAAAAAAAKPAVLKPGDNLVADGIPDIPAEIAEAVGRYTEFRSAGLAGWHPVKREMLISTRFGDTPQVHEVRMPGGARRQLTFFPDRVGGASWPRRSAEYIVFTKDRGGDEFGQIFRLDVATGAITLISDGGRSQNSLGPWSHAGDRMAFGSTRRNGADRDIYVVDPRDPAATRRVLEVKGGGWGPADWSADDRRLAVFEYVSVNESYIWTVDVATGEKTLVTPKGRREGRLRRRAVDRRRKGPLRHHRPGVRVPAPRPPRPHDRQAHLPHVAHPLGRRELRPLPRRQDDRLRDERGGPERPAPARHGHREGEVRLRSSRSASSAASSGTTTAATSAWSSPRLAPPPTSTRWT